MIVSLKIDGFIIIFQKERNARREGLRCNFGKRMSGEGEFAKLLAQRFQIAGIRYKLFNLLDHPNLKLVYGKINSLIIFPHTSYQRLIRWNIREAINKTKNIKNNILATPAKATATPPNPSTAATIAITKNKTIKPNIALLLI